MKTLITFARHYKLFSLALATTATSLILQLSGQSSPANYLLAATALLVAVPLVRGMWDDFRHGTYGIDILAITAIVSSVLLREYWAAIVIVLMLTGGEALEDYAEHRARRELDALLSSAPQHAHILRAGKLVDVAIAEVRVGDKLVVKPGEVVPVDAVIVEGAGSFDETSITGESIPEQKRVKDTILSGSLLIDNAVTAKAVRIAADSQYQQIIKLVEGASKSQAPFVRLADRYSIPFTVFAFLLAGGVWFISGDPRRFLEVIVVATPCPLILAAPIAIISGMSRSARQGIIVRNGSALERLAEARTFAFDKTGTLTQGKPRVSRVTAYGDYSEADVLGFASALEISSTHVLAQAINEAAVERRVRVPKARQVSEIPGHGLSAQVNGKLVLVGQTNLLDLHEVSLPKQFNVTDIKQTATYVAIDSILAGVIIFQDEIRPESRPTINRLKQLGIQNLLMVTGDHTSVAHKVAEVVGIEHVHAQALPADKLRTIDALSQRPVVFVGDGVNDAPVLTAADIGIALGARGSTAASESADIVVMVDDISRVATGYEIAKRTFKIAKQSIFIGIGLSVGLMLVFATGKFEPIHGALVQELVDVVVIFNALRAHTAGHDKPDPLA